MGAGMGSGVGSGVGSGACSRKDEQILTEQMHPVQVGRRKTRARILRWGDDRGVGSSYAQRRDAL